MSVLVKTVEPQVQSRAGACFHLHMAYACSALLLIEWFLGNLNSVQIHNMSSLAIGIFFACAVVFTLATFWHENGKANLRDSILTIPWVFLIAAALPLLVLIAGRSTMPLQDVHLSHLDQSLGVDVPGIVSWSSHHWLGMFINKTYPLLSPFMLTAVLLPAFTGKTENAQQFVMANLMAFAIGLPLFALLPAIGPWYGYGIPPSPGEMQCQAAIMLLRGPGHQVSQVAAIICFPSFHVIWAIFSAAALWGFRVFRIPVALFSTMIVISTVTTGWHYVTDVLGGVAIAGLSLFAASRYTRMNKLQDQALRGVSL
jgi:PAP2 superfamily